VRGLVNGLKLAEEEVPAAEKALALTKARGHWLLALAELEEPGRRPCLLLVAGLPGSGKSALARGLAERAGFSVIRSDVVRKELAGLSTSSDTPGVYGAGLYTPAWTERTYEECVRRAEQLLFEGKRVLVDATFRDESKRRQFLAVALRCGVPALMLVCRAEAETIRKRLGERRGDASDADWSVYLKMVAQWEEPGPEAQRFVEQISTDGSEEQSLIRALDTLKREHLAAPAAGNG
jgi:uncharacterized protein